MKLQATSAAETLASAKHKQPAKASKAASVSTAHVAGDEDDEQEEEAAVPAETAPMDADAPDGAGTSRQADSIVLVLKRTNLYST